MTNLLIQKCTYLTEVCLFSYVFLKELRTSVENSFVERWWGHLLNWINLFSHSHVKLVPNDLGGANFSNLCIQKFLAKYIEEISKLKKFMSNSRDFVQIINLGIGMSHIISSKFSTLLITFLSRRVTKVTATSKPYFSFLPKSFF